jgi:MFS family permease
VKISRRVLIIALILGPFLLIGIMFPSFIQDNFVTPIALVLLLGWRIVESIDQPIYWFGLIFAAALYAFLRLYRLFQVPDTFEQTQSPDSNATLQQINYWWTSLRLTDFRLDRSDGLERDLAHMLAALYASKQFRAIPHEVYSALEQRQVPLPEPVYTFLFPAQSSGAKRSIKQLLRDWRDIPRKRIRRWTGREKAEYYQLLEQTLKFMESVMENEDDDQRFDAHHD